MIAIATCALILVLLVLIVRWFAAIPLVQTIANCIDAGADDVHGGGTEPLR